MPRARLDCSASQSHAWLPCKFRPSFCGSSEKRRGAATLFGRGEFVTDNHGLGGSDSVSTPDGISGEFLKSLCSADASGQRLLFPALLSSQRPPAPGRLSVTSTPPGAKITIDNHDMGKETDFTFVVSPGDHQVSVKEDGRGSVRIQRPCQSPLVPQF